MSKCIEKFFLYNNELKDKREFSESEFKQGKSIYEVIRIIDGKPLFLKLHLRRMENSARITNLRLWLNEKDIKNNILKLIKANEISMGNIKIIFNFYEKNTFLAYFLPYNYPSLEKYEVGVDTIFYHGERENPNAKVINNEFRTKVDSTIKEKKVFEAILVDNSGNITEGSKSNIFMIKGNTIVTAPLKNVLPGTTRKIVMDICSKMGFEVLEKDVSYKDVEKFDALFISGTSPKVLPIKKVENVKFDSSNNKVLLKIMKAYDKEVRDDIENFDRD
ncbi:aminotransferase class IV [Clostridium sp. AWRP]|uniref:aminotransferase class IV n=1 Tax=Clostridium sp. AWRP TaxID=2212991 RepID=UPI000FD6D7B0|nr:aminotransferase class IV [Clostridium sp. AWRP]AZV55907.1 aminotransferase class IV [Clostridium sp. AWRP]